MSVPDFSIRFATAEDLSAITSALAWAIDWRSRATLEAGDLIEATGHAYLLEHWGRAGDTAVVAEVRRTPVGAAWYRYWNDEQHSYGYVAADCPEIGMGVDPPYRAMGIGRAMLLSLVDEAVARGVARLSLSVEGDNPALRLYEQCGFAKVGKVEASWTMVKGLECLV